MEGKGPTSTMTATVARQMTGSRRASELAWWSNRQSVKTAPNTGNRAGGYAAAHRPHVELNRFAVVPEPSPSRPLSPTTVP